MYISACNPLRLALKMNKWATTIAKTHSLSHPSWTCTDKEEGGDGVTSGFWHQNSKRVNDYPQQWWRANPWGLGYHRQGSWEATTTQVNQSPEDLAHELVMTYLWNLPIPGPKNPSLLLFLAWLSPKPASCNSILKMNCFLSAIAWIK